MNTFARAAITVMLCLLAGPVAAQPAVTTLIGRVVDQQAAAVPGATITVQQVATSTIWSATSDGEGRFTFPMLSPGRYDFEASLEAFNPWRTSLTLRGRPAESARCRAQSRHRSRGRRGHRRDRSPSLDGRRRRAVIRTDRVAAAERPQLPRARVPDTRQQPDSGLRSDEDQQRAHLIGGPDGARRQRHYRRPGQQRRCRRRSAAEPADRRRAGVPDRHQPVRRRHRPLGIVGDQRRHALGHQRDARAPRRSSRATTRGRRCRRRWTTPTRRHHSIGSRCPARSAGRFDATASSGSPRASIATRMAASWSARATRPRARSRAASRPRRSQDRLWSLRLDAGGAANRFMVRYAGEWATDTAASAVERAIGSATQRQDGDEPIQQRARHRGRPRRAATSSTR